MTNFMDASHDFDLVVEDAASAVERSAFFLYEEAAELDKAIDTFGTFGSAGTFGGCFGCLGTAGCCC